MRPQRIPVPGLCEPLGQHRRRRPLGRVWAERCQDCHCGRGGHAHGVDPVEPGKAHLDRWPRERRGRCGHCQVFPAALTSWNAPFRRVWSLVRVVVGRVWGPGVFAARILPHGHVVRGERTMKEKKNNWEQFVMYRVCCIQLLWSEILGLVTAFWIPLSSGFSQSFFLLFG
ncbi:hypothetical protein DFJ73DRAFT_864113 [Zopfochytrium polystomum]|nr:hypothetical protein DFJ73DRAFT_864113 [Zopfochytrium polystomum]